MLPRMTEPERRYWVPQWSLADRLRKIRRDSHLSQSDFANAIGVKPTTFAAWEAGQNQPERILELADAIEAAFDVPAAWLLGLMDRPKGRGVDSVAEMPTQRRRATYSVTCVG